MAWLIEVIHETESEESESETEESDSDESDLEEGRSADPSVGRVGTSTIRGVLYS